MKLASDFQEVTEQLCVTAYTAFDFQCVLCKQHVQHVKMHRVEVTPVLISVECSHCHFPNRFRGLKGETVIIGPTIELDVSDDVAAQVA